MIRWSSIQPSRRSLINRLSVATRVWVRDRGGHFERLLCFTIYHSHWCRLIVDVSYFTFAAYGTSIEVTIMRTELELHRCEEVKCCRRWRLSMCDDYDTLIRMLRFTKYYKDTLQYRLMILISYSENLCLLMLSEFNIDGFGEFGENVWQFQKYNGAFFCLTACYLVGFRVLRAAFITFRQFYTAECVS